MIEFEVNKFLKLRLEEGKTVIYINDKRFNQCRYLLLNFEVNQIEMLENIESIDEAAEKLDNTAESYSIKNLISPEEEFWGHCSNLHGWSELGYDSRILHRNLAFPLLKKLNEIGDQHAKKVFKEEIARRLTSGYYTIMKYLIEEKYIFYLTPEELDIIYEEMLDNMFKYQTNSEIIEIISILDEKSTYLNFSRVFSHPNCSESLKHDLIKKELIEGVIFDGKPYSVVDGCLDLRGLNIIDVNNLENVSSIEYLNALKLGGNFLNKESQEVVGKLDKNGNALDPNKLIAKTHLINYIDSILRSRKRFLWSLYLPNMKIVNMDFLKKLKKYDLKTIDLSNNDISEICCLEYFKNLKRLNLNNNRIEKIVGLEKSETLVELRISNNEIKEIEGLQSLNKLKILEIGANKIPAQLIKKLGGFNGPFSNEVADPQKFVKHCQ
ncbi:MAG: hypothetical protein EU530_11435 [Promethearchaeota archaeon]|nr:MAG: hypothetical protein EU530_11435 [Candidatus Lokiarchaeota archaeon]